MKQKIVYIVLLVAGLYLPASSKECAKCLKPAVPERNMPVRLKVNIVEEEVVSLPVSPFSRLFNL